MERTNVDNVSDCLMRALEHADDMEFCVVLYQHKDKNRTGGLFTQKDVTLSAMNWLFDLGKQWLMEPDED